MRTFNRIGRSTNLYEEAVKTIKDAILSGLYRSGEALPNETALAKQLGISRPVVREALKSLQSRGLLEVRRGTKGGAYVKDLNQVAFAEDFADLIRLRAITVEHMAQARLFLEPEIIRLAAMNATDQDLAHMERLLSEYCSTPNMDKRVSLNALFHKLLGRASGNALYAMLMETIMDFTETFVRTIKPVTRIIHNDSEHREMFEAVRDRDSDRAVEIARRHIADIVDKMRQLEGTYLDLSYGNSENVESFEP
ncbi:MAG: FadR/GntR family transcriptional regulator [Desulfobacteraceae bacterium]|jgi:DNA-binding FadR family transcriptional regulator